MRLSIITINRNNADGLRRTLESTFDAQSGFDDWEQIVVDGASTDGSVAVLDKWKDSPHLGWHVSEPDTGIYNAMNKGASPARGDYLLFLNSGDELLPDVLAKVFSRNVTADIAYGGLLFHSRGIDHPFSYPPPEQITPTHFLFSVLPHPASIISRRFFEKMGGYDESYRIVADHKFFLDSVWKGNATLEQIDFPVSRFHEDGISSRPELMELHRKERETVFLPVFGPLVAHRAALPAVLTCGLDAAVLEAARLDPALFHCLHVSSRAIVFLWKFAITRMLLRGGIWCVKISRRGLRILLHMGRRQ